MCIYILVFVFNSYLIYFHILQLSYASPRTDTNNALNAMSERYINVLYLYLQYLDPELTTHHIPILYNMHGGPPRLGLLLFCCRLCFVLVNCSNTLLGQSEKNVYIDLSLQNTLHLHNNQQSTYQPGDLMKIPHSSNPLYCQWLLFFYNDSLVSRYTRLTQVKTTLANINQPILFLFNLVKQNRLSLSLLPKIFLIMK